LIDERIVEVSVIPADPGEHGCDTGIEVDWKYRHGQGAKDLCAAKRDKADVSVLVGNRVRAKHIFELPRAFPEEMDIKT
jgi:hypothetical protein